MEDKMFKGKIYHKKCGYSMCYINNSKRLICSDYHKKGLASKCCRFSIGENDIKELLLLHGIPYENVKKISIDEEGHYEIIQNNDHISSFDGSTIIV